MTFWRTLLPAFVICPSFFPTAAFAASKEIVELQRDLALLQEQVRTLQRAQDEKFSADEVKAGRYPLRPLPIHEEVVTRGVIEMTSALENLLSKESIKFAREKSQQK